ncbi:hypothetical protein L9F63_000548, partial [Diploptera punctata]
LQTTQPRQLSLYIPPPPGFRFQPHLQAFRFTNRHPRLRFQPQPPGFRIYKPPPPGFGCNKTQTASFRIYQTATAGFGFTNPHPTFGVSNATPG